MQICSRHWPVGANSEECGRIWSKGGQHDYSGNSIAVNQSSGSTCPRVAHRKNCIVRSCWTLCGYRCARGRQATELPNVWQMRWSATHVRVRMRVLVQSFVYETEKTKGRRHPRVKRGARLNRAPKSSIKSTVLYLMKLSEMTGPLDVSIASHHPPARLLY